MGASYEQKNICIHWFYFSLFPFHFRILTVFIQTPDPHKSKKRSHTKCVFDGVSGGGRGGSVCVCVYVDSLWRDGSDILHI